MKRIILLSISIFLFGNLMLAQYSAIEEARAIIKERGEVYFKFNIDDSSLQLDKLSKVISIDNIKNESVFAYANKKDLNQFLDFEIPFQVLTAPSMLHNPRMLDSDEALRNREWDYYPSYQAYLDIMEQFTIDYPDMCELINIGMTNEGRELLCLRINNDLEDEADPEFLYTSSIHGDELTGYVVMLRLIEYLLENYGTDDQATFLVDNIDIWINPLANPDGTFAGGNNSVYGATRGNAYGIDMNRNYPDPEDGDHPDGNAWQTETVHFMEFAEAHNFVMAANFHGGAEVVNYPWDTWYTRHADTDWWELVSRQFADTAHVYSPSGYMTDLDNGVSNGYDWYSISGGRQDYMNYFHHCREVTLEVSGVKLPPANQLPGFWEYLHRSCLNYMEQVLYGFRGTITDASNNNPIIAEVFIYDHDELETQVYSSLPAGNYHRPIKGGLYNVTFSKFGYFPETIENLEIYDNEIELLDIELHPITELTAGFEANNTLFGIGGTVDFSDQSYGTGISEWKWLFEGGTPESSFEQNPQNILYSEAGDFDVSLTVYDNDGDSSVLMIENYIKVREILEMDNETISRCNVLFYDAGGDNNYGDNENYTMTITPDADLSWLRVEFMEFNVEFQSNCNYDYLEIYDGSDMNAPLLGKWCGTDSPGMIVADNEDGALTFYFSSDQNTTNSGWKALVSCDTSVGISDSNDPKIRLYPNPVSDLLRIETDFEIEFINVSDASGRKFISENANSKNVSIDLSSLQSGIYIVHAVGKDASAISKIIKR
ncbi:MAG: M14 family zinc carboxypeptidase [Bacteroidales bacterium]|nr:M14 family zinc carboxypeptidase [Bacteroidales bacterium]